ncbi:MAG: hypothetical protein AAF431_18295 [Pseudomonadota bacterium]
MATVKNLKVQELSLDLSNYRTIPQSSERNAIEALIAINPSKFWGLMKSLLADGYSPTENIIVLNDGRQIVKEGNRRIASLKLIHSLVKNVELPDDIQETINELPAKWLKDNERVPCAVYPSSQREFVQRLVSRTHAKNQPSGRDDWNSVAKARYGRNETAASEPALDLLEKYLKSGKNLSPEQAERWAGDYPLTVLDEAIKKVAPLLKMESSIKVSYFYPKKNKRILDNVMFDIGVGQLGFKQLRAKSPQPHWGERYGLGITEPEQGTSPGADNSPNDKPQGTPKTKKKPVATPINDPNAVRKALRSFVVRGVT